MTSTFHQEHLDAARACGGAAGGTFGEEGRPVTADDLDAGQAARPAVVRASVRTTVSITSTDSTNTPSTDENSSSFNCGGTSFTAKDCRPHHRPARRFSGGLQ
jgi:hypothetical protein